MTRFQEIILIIALVFGLISNAMAGENRSDFLAPETFDVVHTVPPAPPQAALMRIVENHPDPELRSWFKRNLRERRFAVTWMHRLPGTSVGDQHQCMQVMRMERASVLYVSDTPVLVARIDFLTDPRIPDTERYMALYHEWVHLQDVFDDSGLLIFVENGTELAARNLYKGELKAYYKQALFAKKYGFSTKLFSFPIDTYRQGGVGALRFFLAMHMVSSREGLVKFREAILEEASTPFPEIPLQ